MELKQNKLPAKYEEKTVPFEIKSVTADGQFEGYAAIFGEPDSMNEVIEKGAFSKSLREGKTRPILWYHDPRQPIGMAELEEDSKGLKVRGQLNLEVQNAREKHALMKQKVIEGLSFGYKTIQDLWKGAVRILKEVKIYEISPVTFQAHPAALISAVKDAEADAGKKALKDELRIEIKKEIKEEVKEAMIEIKPKTDLEEINMLKRKGDEKAAQYTQEEWDSKSPLLKKAEKHFATMGWNQMPYDQSKALHESWPEYTGPPPRSGVTGYEKKAEIEPTSMSFIDDAGKEHKALSFKEKLFVGEEEFNIGRLLAARITGSNRGCTEFEKKELSEGLGSTGGWLLSETVSAKVINLARNAMVLQRAGAITLPMETAELRLVKITSDPNAAFRGENEEIVESDWSLAPINLKAMSIGCLVSASKELIEDASNSGQMLSQAISAAIALAVDRAGILGGGTTEPRGIFNCDGINEIDLGENGLALTSYDEFSQAVEAIHNSNGEPNSVIYSPRTNGSLDRLKAATTNQPLIPPQSFIDLKKFKTNQIGNAFPHGTATTCSIALVGDFKNLVLGIRKNVEISISGDAGDAFKKVQTKIRAVMRIDWACLRENHFTKITGILG